jgi:hypothetical protein
MCYFRVLAATLVAALGWAGPAAAGPMLTGGVTYDPATRLYTYSYTLDDRAALAPIDQIYIRIASGVSDFNLAPIGHTGPAPFTDFTTYVGGGPASYPSGTMFGWNAYRDWDTLTRGVRTGFSFTTPHAPSAEAADNYSLFSTASTFPPHNLVDGHLEYGWVVAPDFNQALSALEPGALLLVSLGLASVGLRAGWRRRWGHPTTEQQPQCESVQ